MTNILRIGKEVLQNESNAVRAASRRLDASFVRAVRLIYRAKGKVVLSGIGKSGIVARKIAATLSSTGTMSFFVHPVEALHGDLGMIGKDDIVIIISHSGETPELAALAAVLEEFKNKIILITANHRSTLGAYADIILNTYVREEACRICTAFNLAPTTSTLVELALGDALGSALQELKGFTSRHFARLHPGGALGTLLAKKKS